MKAGWILKSKGRWSVTEQGLKAYKGFKDPEKFTSEVRRLYRPWAANRPEPSDDIAEEEAEAADVTGTFEEAEESAWIDIERHLRSMAPYDFQNLVAALLRAMGYHVSWIAPPGRGCVSIHQMVHGRALSVRVLAHDEAQPPVLPICLSCFPLPRTHLTDDRIARPRYGREMRQLRIDRATVASGSIFFLGDLSLRPQPFQDLEPVLNGSQWRDYRGWGNGHVIWAVVLWVTEAAAD